MCFKTASIVQYDEEQAVLNTNQLTFQGHHIYHEHHIPASKKLTTLVIYLICNIGLTLYNKYILKATHIPWLLTALHTFSASIGCLIMLKLGYFKLTKPSRRQNLTLLAFSMLFTTNIAVSNISLSLVSIPLHQTVRSTVPIFTTSIYTWFFSRKFSLMTYLSLLPTILGVMITTYGEYSYTLPGILLTFLGVILAALKTIITNRLLTKQLAISSHELLLRMSALACVQAFWFAFVSSEVRLVYAGFQESVARRIDGKDVARVTEIRTEIMWWSMVILGNGMVAFMLNVSSFQTNRDVGALSMAVCANVKQCLTIVLGMLVFEVAVTKVMIGGIVMTVMGGVAYSYVELKMR